MESQSLLFEIQETPAISFTIAICSTFWLYILHKNIEYDEIALSYRKIIKERELWRVLTSTFAHFHILHLVFNMSSMWSLRIVELQFGWLFYLKYSFLLMCGSALLILISYHILIYYFHMERYENSLAVGFSCVVFGWMTFVSVISSKNSLSFFGIAIPLSIAPFFSLIFTSLMIQNASFIGHLSGIVVGYLIAFNEHLSLNLFSNYAFICLFMISCILVLLNTWKTSFLLAFQNRQEASRFVLRDGILERRESVV